MSAKPRARPFGGCRGCQRDAAALAGAERTFRWPKDQAGGCLRGAPGLIERVFLDVKVLLYADDQDAGDKQLGQEASSGRGGPA
jgi:hypothetical protein